MRICLVGPAWPYRGGISHYNTCLAKELLKRHDVDVVNFSRLYPDAFFPGKTQYDESGSAHMVPSSRIIDSINPFTWIRAGLRIARSRPDLTIVQWWHPFFAPALAKICLILRLFGGTKIIMICHNVVPHEPSAVDRLLTRIAFAPAHGFVVQSRGDGKDLAGIRRNARFITRAHPVYDFFRTGDTGRSEARESIGEPGGPLVLFFGYIRAYKGLDHLIRAMSLVRKSLDARLLVVGEFYEDRSPYDELVKVLGLDGAVRFVDRYVGNEEVHLFFTASDIVVLPYNSATQSGIAQIAMAFHRPMIVTDVGGLAETVSEGRTGFVVKSGDPEAIADRIVAFFRQDLAGRMEPCFEEEMKRFTWSGLTEAIDAFYLDISAGR